MRAIQPKSVSMAVLCSVAVMAIGCATPTNRLYSGDALPPEKVAVVIEPADELFFGTQAFISEIDGKRIDHSSWDGSAFVELLPGLHAISVGMNKQTWYGSKFSLRDRTFRLQAEAGHRYEIRIKWSTKGGDDRWDPEAIDKGINPIPPSKTAPAQ
jgi:hypothetical protein